MAPVSAGERRTVLAAARGVALAAHATAGLSCSVDKECERLMRCCEGIARAAVARLEALGRTTSEPPRVPPCSGGVAKKVEKAEEKELDLVKKKRRSRPKKCTVVARCDTSAAMETELADEWADSIGRMELEDQPRLKKSRAATPAAPEPSPPDLTALDAMGSSSAASATSTALVIPNETRSARGGTPQSGIGSVATLRGLKQVDLNGQQVRLLDFDVNGGRWLVQPLKGGDPIRVKPGHLK